MKAIKPKYALCSTSKSKKFKAPLLESGKVQGCTAIASLCLYKSRTFFLNKVQNIEFINE